MTTTVQTTVLADGRRNYIVRRQGVQTDTTGESAQVLADISGVAAMDRVQPLSFAVKKIQYASQGFQNIQLFFDATSDDECVKIPGNESGVMEFDPPLNDPRSSGYTGDILITTSDGTVADNATYDLTLHLVKKQ